MSFMPGKFEADPLSSVMQFMDKRASAPVLPPSVEAFMKRDSKDGVNTPLKDTLDSGAIVVGADAELRKAGYSSPEHSKLAADGEVARGADAQSVKEERQKRQQAGMDFLRAQQEMYAELVADVERYNREFQAAQLESAEARQQLEEAQRNLETAEQRKAVASENTSQVSRETAMAIRDLEGHTIEVDGKRLRLNGSGGYVDEQGNLVDSQTVAEKAEGPVADAMAQAAAMTEARRMLRLNEGNAEQAVQTERASVDAAEAEAARKSQAEQEAAQRLQNAEQRRDRFEQENPDIAGKTPASSAHSMTAEEYDANRAERLEATETTGFVGGDRIEVTKLKLGGHFRSAAEIPETDAPAQAQPGQVIGITNDMTGLDMNRYAPRAPAGAVIGAP